MSEGTRTILLTVIISGAAAILFPVKQEDTELSDAEESDTEKTNVSSEVSHLKAEHSTVTETIKAKKGDNIHE